MEKNKTKEIENETLEKVTGGTQRNPKYKWVCNACGHVWHSAIIPKKCEKCSSPDVRRK